MAEPAASRKRIALDLLPVDILSNIISMAGVNSLLLLVEDGTFMKLNPNLKRAINHEIARKSLFVFDCHYTVLEHQGHFWDIHDSWIENTVFDLRDVEELLMFDNYCLKEQLRVHLVIKFSIFTPSYYFGLQQLISNLQPNNNSTIGFDMRLCDSGTDFTKLNDTLFPIKDRITELSMEMYDDRDCDLDVGYLKNIEVLNLLGALVLKGPSLDKCYKLRKLAVSCQVTDVSELPQSLKILCIDRCYILGLGNGCIVVPDSIEILKLIEVYTEVRHKFVFQRSLNSLCLPRTGFQAIDAYRFGFDVDALESPTNDLQFTLDAINVAGNLRELDLSDNRIKTLRGAHFPDNLKELNLSGNLINNFEGVQFPDNLRTLDLSSNGIQTLSGAQFPSYLTTLNLSSNSIETLYRAQFPNSLKVLNLSRNGIGSLEDAVFPKYLTHLNLDCNSLESLENVTFPGSLVELDLSFNRFGNVSADIIPKCLKRLSVLVTEAFNLSNGSDSAQFELQSLCLSTDDAVDIYLSTPGLTTIELNGMQLLDSQDLGKSLTLLTLLYCFLDKESLSLEKYLKLQYLEIQGCKFPSQFELPQSLTEIVVLKSNFEEIPSQWGQLRNLKRLKFRENHTKTAIIEFLYNSIEVIDLSKNGIKEVQLLFAPVSTKLQLLSLASNELMTISSESIGQNSKIKHERLKELILSGNRLLLKTHINELKVDLPNTTTIFWNSAYINEMQSSDSSGTGLDLTPPKIAL